MDLELNPKELCGKFLLVTTETETQFYFIKKLIPANLAGSGEYLHYEVLDLIHVMDKGLILMDVIVKALLASNIQQYTLRYTHHVSVKYEIL